MLSKRIDRGSGWVKLIKVESMQPRLSVTNTLYIPALKPEIILNAEGDPPFKEYVNGALPEPVLIRIMAVESLLHLIPLNSKMVGDILVVDPAVALAVAVHPALSVTVTVYVPGNSEFAVEVNLAGTVFQTYE